MFISRRMAGLLEKAARRLAAGANPFHHQWLKDENVTLAECEQMPGLMAAALRVFLRTADQPASELRCLSAGQAVRPDMFRWTSETGVQPESVDQN